jgi:hypothetical protein
MPASSGKADTLSCQVALMMEPGKPDATSGLRAWLFRKRSSVCDHLIVVWNTYPCAQFPKFSKPFSLAGEIELRFGLALGCRGSSRQGALAMFWYLSPYWWSFHLNRFYSYSYNISPNVPLSNKFCGQSSALLHSGRELAEVCLVRQNLQKIKQPRQSLNSSFTPTRIPELCDRLDIWSELDCSRSHRTAKQVISEATTMASQSVRIAKMPLLPGLSSSTLD